VPGQLDVAEAFHGGRIDEAQGAVAVAHVELVCDGIDSKVVGVVQRRNRGEQLNEGPSKATTVPPVFATDLVKCREERDALRFFEPGDAPEPG